jgi:hypothetical protein
MALSDDPAGDKCVGYVDMEEGIMEPVDEDEEPVGEQGEYCVACRSPLGVVSLLTCWAMHFLA